MSYATPFGLDITVGTPIGTVKVGIPVQQLVNEAWPPLEEKLKATAPELWKKLEPELLKAVPKLLDKAQPKIREEADHAIAEARFAAFAIVAALVGGAYAIRRLQHKKVL